MGDEDGGDGKTAFSEGELKFIQGLFKSFDTDGSGKIDFREFKILARKLGVEMSDQELKKSIEAVDTDGNLELDFDEFTIWLQSAQAEGTDPFSMLKVKIKAQGKKALSNTQIQGLKECFNHFDKDGSGSIDREELGEVFAAFGQEMSEEELEQLMDDVDDDKSGEIEFEEFLMLMVNNFGEEAQAELEVQERFKQDETPDKPGQIHEDKLKDAIEDLCGDCLPREEIENIVASLEKKDGMVEYEKWEELWEALRDGA